MSDPSFHLLEAPGGGALSFASSVRDVLNAAVVALRRQDLRVLSPTPGILYTFLDAEDGPRLDGDVGGGLCLWTAARARPRVVCRQGAMFHLPAYARTCRWLLERGDLRPPGRFALAEAYLGFTGFETERIEPGVCAVQRHDQPDKWFFLKEQGLFSYLDQSDGMPIQDVRIDIENPGRVASMADALLRPSEV